MVRLVVKTGARGEVDIQEKDSLEEWSPKGRRSRNGIEFSAERVIFAKTFFL